MNLKDKKILFRERILGARAACPHKTVYSRWLIISGSPGILPVYSLKSDKLENL